MLDEAESVVGFLNEVLDKNNGIIRNRGHIYVIAIHSVLLESGLIGFDMNLKTEINGFQLRSSNGYTFSQFYTLPGIINNNNDSDFRACVVELKFKDMGKCTMVYGSRSNDSSGSVTRFVCLVNESTEILEFWRRVKDGLALPLLIDLRESAGLGLPPCFRRLPFDLQLKILESLPGVDVAKVSCVSRELRYLASNDDLWKHKFVQQFGDACTSHNKVKIGFWKENFARIFISQKFGLGTSVRPSPLQRFSSVCPHWTPYDIYPEVYVSRITADDIYPEVHIPRITPLVRGGDDDIYPEVHIPRIKSLPPVIDRITNSRIHFSSWDPEIPHPINMRQEINYNWRKPWDG